MLREFGPVRRREYGSRNTRYIAGGKSVDAGEYYKKHRDKNTKPLNILTNGIHYHTIEADNEEILYKIEDRLRKLGYLM